MIVLGFPESAAQAAAFADALAADYADVGVHRFPDGESRLSLPPSLPAGVVLFRSLHDPNAKLTELLIAAGGARALGARRIALVTPYLCYMRQDKAFAPGQPVSQRIVGELLAKHFEAIVTVDPHLHRVATLAEAVPAAFPVCLTAASLLGEFLRDRIAADAVLLGPDDESEQWVSRVAAPGGFAFGVASKQRFSDTDVRVTLPPLAVDRREVVLVDDVISSGHTMMAAATQLRAAGAASVSAIATHGLFAPGAGEGMRQSGISRCWTSDAIPNPAGVIPLAGLMADGLRSSGFFDH